MIAAAPNVVIRAVLASDAEGMCALANMPGYRWGTLRQPHESVDYWQRRIDQRGPADVWLVAELDGRLVGSAGLHPRPNPRAGYVADLGMGVADDHAGKGIGTRLLSELLDIADNWRGIKRVQLEVFVDNEGALALYRKHGFEIEGRLVKAALRGGQYVDQYVMARLRF